jgi:hypothetical protein
LNKYPREVLIRWLQKPDNQSLWEQVHFWIVAQFLQVLDGAAGSIIVSSFGLLVVPLLLIRLQRIKCKIILILIVVMILLTDLSLYLHYG